MDVWLSISTCLPMFRMHGAFTFYMWPPTSVRLAVTRGSSQLQDLAVCSRISWKCGLLATRVGEASHLRPAGSLEPSQPSDILGTALQEAHPSISHVSPDVTPSHSRPGFQCCASGSVSAPPPLPVPGSASLLRPAPLDSARAPNCKRHASCTDRWYCLVQSCPDHCPHCWSSFNATTGHGERHLGGFLEGGLPLDWLEGTGYGVRQFCNQFRGKCPSCWPPLSSPNQAYLRAPALQRHASTRSDPWHTDPLAIFDPLGARDLWSRCLNAALAGVIANTDSRARTDLPSLVIPSPTRGGTSRTRRSTNETRRRCQGFVWNSGIHPKGLPTGTAPRDKCDTRVLTRARRPHSSQGAPTHRGGLHCTHQ